LVFEFDKSRYHLTDCIVGKVTFKKVSIRLKSMEIQLVKKETILSGSNKDCDTMILGKFELMDGGPFKSKAFKKMK
jgi:vacuolar protein sorting-associated protein 26